MKDPVEVGLPTRNSIFVVPRVKKSRDSVPSALFSDLPLYFRDSPAIENRVSGRARTICRRSDSRRQLIYRITNRLTEVVWLLSIHSPVEGSTDVSTG